jgi:isopenicillin N synthase-like dioxygenase
MTTIPFLDLNAENIEQAFFEAYSHVGFAYLINHGIASELRESLFDIPLLPQNPNFFMGYDAEIV